MSLLILKAETSCFRYSFADIIIHGTWSVLNIFNFVIIEIHNSSLKIQCEKKYIHMIWYGVLGDLLFLKIYSYCNKLNVFVSILFYKTHLNFNINICKRDYLRLRTRALLFHRFWRYDCVKYWIIIALSLSDWFAMMNHYVYDWMMVWCIVESALWMINSCNNNERFTVYAVLLCLFQYQQNYSLNLKINNYFVFDFSLYLNIQREWIDIGFEHFRNISDDSEWHACNEVWMIYLSPVLSACNGKLTFSQRITL